MAAPKGSYYIRVLRTTWLVSYQSYTNGVRKQEAVAKAAYAELGFKKEMSVDEAKRRCKILNGERELIKDKVRQAAKRVTEITSLNETLFPTDACKEFEDLVRDENFGSEEHFKKLVSHFQFVQTMCNALRILPSEYKDASKRIYKYFISKKISVNYASRVLSILNRWGKFRARATQSYFEPVKVPGGRERAAIADAQVTKSGVDTELGVRTASLPLTPEQLLKAKAALPEPQYNWLLLSVWLGLRPWEVNLLSSTKNYRIEYNLKYKRYVLSVYQSKLTSVAEKDRWKRIPIIFAEQETCIEIIKSGVFKRPLHKIVRKYVGRGITLYGGRKGFLDLMLSKGQTLENASIWLGHKDISTSWKHYKDRLDINFTETPATKTRTK